MLNITQPLLHLPFILSHKVLRNGYHCAPCLTDWLGIPPVAAKSKFNPSQLHSPSTNEMVRRRDPAYVQRSYVRALYLF